MTSTVFLSPVRLTGKAWILWERQGENPPLRQGFPAAPARPLPSFRARKASLVQPGRPSPPPSLTPLPPFKFGPPFRLIARDQNRRNFIFHHPKRRT